MSANPSECSVEECDRRTHIRGMCSGHAARLKNWGEVRPEIPLRVRMDGASLAEKLEAYVDRSAGPGSCWPWTRTRTEDGYGRVFDGRKNLAAHRVAFMLATGEEIPSSVEVMHSCDNPPCCNPAHLSTGTHAENMGQMSARDRARRGPTNSLSRGLTAEQVAAARHIRAQGVKNADIAALVGMSKSYISRVVRGDRRPRG